jgi:threonine dehydratase
VGTVIPLQSIHDAAGRIGGRIHRTPLLTSRTIGEAAGVRLYLKCENLQKTGSFKPRGALNKILTLAAEERQRGLITVSAGNHAQAVAWAAKDIGVKCIVVMPKGAPQSKIDAVRGYGGNIIFEDRSALFERLHKEREARGSIYIDPFDDAVVLAGAGTSALEIMEDLPGADVVIVPVGGGGLMAGITSAVKAVRPATRVVAVELEAGPGLGPALEAGRPIEVPRPSDTLADGMTPPFVGKHACEIAREAVDQIVTVTEQEIVDALRLLVTRAKLYVEGSGAAATAALISGKIDVRPGDHVVAIVSGGNVDFNRLATALT